MSAPSPALIVVSDPLPFTWGALARAAAPSTLVVVTTDLALDARHDDPREAFDATSGLQVGPASGGAVAGPGAIALASRVGIAFPRIVEGIDVHEAVDLGRGWGLDEAALIARWLDAGVRAIGLVAPRPSARLAHALALARGRVPVVVLDPAGRDWSPHGAATVTSLAALRLALTLPTSSIAPAAPALLGTSGPALDAVRAALAAHGITTRPASDAARAAIAQEVSAHARLDAVNDLTLAATARHLAHATAVLAAEGPVVVVDDALAADPRAAAEALVARRALALTRPVTLLPLPLIAAERAHALLGAALITRQPTSSREHALALAAALGIGKPAPTLHVASLGAAREAARTLLRRDGDRAFMGAPGVAPRPAPALEEAWDDLAAALAPTDPFAARWLAVAPPGADLTLTITRGPVGPVARWTCAPSSGEAGETGETPLPARADAAPSRLPAPLPVPWHDLLAAASAAALALPALARLTVHAVASDGAVTLVDADCVIAAEEEG